MKLIIFDCDGVLVNSEEIYLSAEIEFLASRGAGFERSFYTRTYMGLAPDDWTSKLLPEIERLSGKPSPPDFFVRMDEYTTGEMWKNLATLPDVYQTVSELKMMKCVASSSPTERLHWKLQRTGLIGLFDPGIFSADMVRKGKPAPDLFLHAAASMGVHPGECVVVEDSANGVAAGKAAGMYVVGLTAGNHCGSDHEQVLFEAGADAIARHFCDIPSLLNSREPQ